VIDATVIEEKLKGPLDCFCYPKVHNRKHQCMLTLQFALLRLTGTPGPDAELAAPPRLTCCCHLGRSCVIWHGWGYCACCATTLP
jgi:hypothetical protein